jgi:CubicO group peptidase (beta-lactamase class C family)
MNRKSRFLILNLLFVTLSVSSTAFAQSDKIDQYVTAEMAKRKIPGLALVVVKNGEIVKAKGYGLASVELKVPVTPETIFQSGSVGKQFTSTLVMMLAEEGKIGIDDPISKYLPDAPEIWKGITVRHLLTHTSGISNNLYRQINMRQDYTEDELLKKIASIPLDFQPGERWRYSNPGYILLGIIVGKVTGKFYGDVMREKIFAPLGMTTARVINEEDIIPNRAAGYRLVNGELKNQQWVAPRLNTTADGSLYMTVLDLAKWDAALYGEKLLKRASLDMMWTPVKLTGDKIHPYGFGWSLGEVRGHRIVGHGGAWQGFTSYISRYVNDKFTVVALTNLVGQDPGTIVSTVAGLYNPELQPVERKAIKLDAKVFDPYVGDYQLNPSVNISVSREEDKFYVQVTGQPKVEMLAESDTKFFLRVVDAQITFVKDDKGQVTHLILNQNGEIEAKKIK